MSELLQRLQDANQVLGSLVHRLSRHDECGQVTPDHLATLFSVLLGVGERIEDRGTPGNDPALDSALCQYREHLERLRRLLPALQASLLTERARLEAERSHLEAACSWAEGARYTR